MYSQWCITEVYSQWCIAEMCSECVIGAVLQKCFVCLYNSNIMLESAYVQQLYIGPISAIEWQVAGALRCSRNSWSFWRCQNQECKQALGTPSNGTCKSVFENISMISSRVFGGFKIEPSMSSEEALRWPMNFLWAAMASIYPALICQLSYLNQKCRFLIGWHRYIVLPM